MTKYISRGILIPRVCSKPTILPLLKAQYVFPRNKGKEKRLSYKFFKRHYSNLSYIAITDLAPTSPDSVPTVGSGTAQGFLATKAKQLRHTSNKEPVAGAKGLSLGDWEKGQQAQGAGLSAPTAHDVVQQTSRSSSPVGWAKQKAQPRCLDAPGTQLPWLCPCPEEVLV